MKLNIHNWQTPAPLRGEEKKKAETKKGGGNGKNASHTDSAADAHADRVHIQIKREALVLVRLSISILKCAMWLVHRYIEEAHPL